jgi:hypothetical protein
MNGTIVMITWLGVRLWDDGKSSQEPGLDSMHGIEDNGGRDCKETPFWSIGWIVGREVGTPPGRKGPSGWRRSPAQIGRKTTFFRDPSEWGLEKVTSEGAR